MYRAYQLRLASTLPEVRRRMAAGAEAAGRDPNAIRLVAVTKGHPVGALQAALDAGLRDLGENRVEEMEEKVAALGADAAVWHMIGHLQSRKAARAVGVAHLIHSVDSLRLAERVSRAAGEGSRAARILVQNGLPGSGYRTWKVIGNDTHTGTFLSRLRAGENL
ncbi:MAG TPA: alanine racemase [Longimicrobiales bacterium]|nr:alanine racemase [Longimicrobiales bacterium]